MITIFTPTYNRGYIIEKLYLSLCNQTSNEFEWLVVDDGSTDNTKDLIEQFIADNKINVRYIYKENGGKHTAINLGVKNARGELFFIVDSDDYLIPSAISLVINYYNNIINNEHCAGIGFMRCNNKMEIIGNKFPFDTFEGSAHQLNELYNVNGDMAEVYKTDILRMFPFPNNNEKFCPEALIWHRIADKYNMLWVNRAIYCCEYIPDGLTAKIVKVRMNAPLNSMQFYSEEVNRNLSYKLNLRSAINFWRFSFNSDLNFISKCRMVRYIYYPLIIVGYLFYLKDKYYE